MKPRHRQLAVLAGIFAGVFWWLHWPPEPTVLSFYVGQSFEEVVRNSTYPAMEHANLPDEDPSGDKFGNIWVTEPAVIIHFDDPHHGFMLPPTRFAALGFAHNVAATLATSPMLDKLPFDEAIAVLENLQNQFKKGGWLPWEGDGSKWFDLTPEGKKRLYARMFEPGYSQSAELRVPTKYAMTFRLKCAEGCWTREPPYKFLVDVGVGRDTHEWWDKTDPEDRPTIPRETPEDHAAGNTGTAGKHTTPESGPATGPDDMPLVLLDPETEKPFRHQRYTIELTDRVIEGTTDEYGATRPLTAAERASVIGWHLGIKKARSAAP